MNLNVVMMLMIIIYINTEYFLYTINLNECIYYGQIILMTVIILGKKMLRRCVRSDVDVASSVRVMVT